MKKLLLLLLSAFCFGACSVDTVENESIDSQLLVMDATFVENGCKITTFNLGDAGSIEVRNDLEFIYVNLFAYGDYQIIESYLHIAADLSGFPTTGNITNPGISMKDMDHKETFNSGVKEYTYKFEIGSFGDSFLIGSYTSFQLGKKKYNFWAGDLDGNKWSHFKYDLFKHPYAGTDKLRTITVSEAAAAESWDEVRKLFSNMLDPGVPRGWRDGSYEPSIWELIYMFNDPEKESMAGEYTTTYTLGTGECTDSVILTVIVVPDPL